MTLRAFVYVLAFARGQLWCQVGLARGLCRLPAEARPSPKGGTLDRLPDRTCAPQSCQVLRPRGRPRICHSPEGPRETGRVHVVWVPGGWGGTRGQTRGTPSRARTSAPDAWDPLGELVIPRHRLSPRLRAAGRGGAAGGAPGAIFNFPAALQLLGNRKRARTLSMGGRSWGATSEACACRRTSRIAGLGGRKPAGAGPAGT